MQNWKVRFGRGWRDTMPPEVQKLRDLILDDGREGILSLQAHTHLDAISSSSYLPFYDVLQPSELVADVFGSVAEFLKHLTQPEFDVVSIIWANYKPFTFSLEPRPEPKRMEVENVTEGVQVFLSTVAKSITRGEGMWSVCEWAILSCSRVAKEADLHSIKNP